MLRLKNPMMMFAIDGHLVNWQGHLRSAGTLSRAA